MGSAITSLRRRHHRRRTQRARVRRVSCPRRSVGLRSRAARGSRWRRGHRGIPSGFRNSTASYTVSLLNPKVIRDLDLARHGLRIVERPVSNFLPLPDDRHLVVGGGIAATQAEFAKFSRRDADALPGYYAMLDRVADVLRDLLRRNAAQCRRRCFTRCSTRGRSRSASARSTSQGVATCSTSSPRARATCLDRWFESEPVEGGVRLRRGRRQLCEPVDAGLGVRAAASRVRRGERQAWDVGPCRSEEWARSRRQWQRNARRAASCCAPAHRCARGRESRRERSASSSTSGDVLSAQSAWWRNVTPKVLFERLVADRSICRPIFVPASQATAAGPARSG